MSSISGSDSKSAAHVAVAVESVTKIYPGGVEALNNMTLEFPKGELTSLLGPSGCGKTTLLKIIAGLLPATSGTVTVNGEPVTGPGKERAFVFQDFALMPWASIIRNVAFGLELQGVAKSERMAIAEKHIAEVGLKGFENHFPHQLSGGMRQRVGLARALAVDAEVLLMDEPFSAVDEQTRRKFQEELLGVVASQKKTFIFVTHSIEEAVYVSHSIALLLPPPGNNDLWHRPDCSGNPISDTSRMQPMRNGSKIFIQGHEQARVESKNIYLKKGAEKRALLTTEEFKEIVDREVR